MEIYILLDALDSHLSETGQYPLYDDLSPQLKSIVQANYQTLNQKLLERNLPPYYYAPLYRPPELSIKPVPPQVPSSRFRPTREPSELPILQKAAINLVVDYYDKRSLKAKLQTLNVTTVVWNQWLKERTFQSLLKREISRRFGNLESDAQLSLAKLVTDGDLQAIKYYHEFTGIYRPELNNETTLNLTRVLANLMEVLVKFLTPEQLNEVADVIETTLSNSNAGPVGKSLTFDARGSQ